MVDGGGAVVGHLEAVVLVVLHGAGGVGRELERHVAGVGAVRALGERERGLRLALQHDGLGDVAGGTTCDGNTWSLDVYLLEGKTFELYLVLRLTSLNKSKSGHLSLNTLEFGVFKNRCVMKT